MLSKGMIWLIRFYRNYLSAYKGGPTCIYVPTCSAYAIQALQRYGFWKGSFFAVKRILRCHPFHRGGYDPLP